MSEPTGITLVLGGSGLVGSAIRRTLQARGDELVCPGSDELDLLDQGATAAYIGELQPSCIYHAAARVGGILANSRAPADFGYENLMIACNVIHAAHEAGNGQLLFLGSSCIYPREAEQPMEERALLTGPLEPTNQAYAIAKIAGIELCRAYREQHGRDYRALMPTNLYGPGDNFDPEASHVIPGLIRRMHEAKQAGEATFAAWGTGSPLREFLHVDDLARACVHAMECGPDAFLAACPGPWPMLNVGSDDEVSIRELTELVQQVIGFEGEILWDSNKPDGTPRKRLDSAAFHSLGWKPRIGLRDGLEETYTWFLRHGDSR